MKLSISHFSAKPVVQYKAIPHKAATFLDPAPLTVEDQVVEPLSDILDDLPHFPDSMPDAEGLARIAKVVATRGASCAWPGVTGLAIQQANLPQNWICKRDQYPGIHNKKIQSSGRTHPAQPLIEGAPNYRKLTGHKIHGMGQPTIEAWREVLKRAGADKKPVVWVNLREEPVVYVKGEPHCVREHDLPHHNLVAEGITTVGVELAEEGLRNRFMEQMDVLKGHLWLNDEERDGSINGSWWRAHPDEVQTPRDVVEQLREEGFMIEYHRIPVSDEHAPQTDDLNDLIEIFSSVSDDKEIFVNCHAGRGRTTTAMAVATMIDLKKQDDERVTHSESARAADSYALGFGPQGLSPMAQVFSELAPHRVLADTAIGKVSQVQNIRKAVFDKKLAPTAPGQHSSVDETSRMIRYTERYLKLIEVAQYLNDQPPFANFEEWSGVGSKATKAVNLAKNTLREWHIRNHGQG